MNKRVELVKALQKDFNTLYVKEFTTAYKANRLVRNIEISIMRLDNVEKLITEAYKQGHIDGAIEVVNNTCDICGSYPMTTNCNNANCDV